MNRSKLLARIEELREEYRTETDPTQRAKIAALGKMASTLKDVLYPEGVESRQDTGSPLQDDHTAPQSTADLATEIFAGKADEA